MPLSTLINRPCTIVRRSASGSTDDYGNDIPSEVAVENWCEVQQVAKGQPGEPVDVGERADKTWTAFFLPGTELDTGDAVEVDGIGTLEVVGAPWAARNPRSRKESHVEATLRRVAGSENVS